MIEELTELDGFHIGDKVWADKAEFDTFEDPFTVVRFGKNSLGWPMAYVAYEDDEGHVLCFYTRELSHRA